ncbi:hypothetical protein [Candidatus Oleimmundimicrobium sp.]|uniref:hypothetical protein n=1 Tax=Candidatus Oleimmundimicrobium sp. TaxID=3060597 RepID=UPI00271AFE23|nr:hypothetical protein [Candidatus Oleimmundimicrobium sp.]MDO8886728.1 hypothetical protein [Candidatus Oleimmundimicrobium sp.]
MNENKKSIEQPLEENIQMLQINAYEDFLFEKDNKLSSTKAIVAQIYINLEKILQIGILILFLKQRYNQELWDLFEDEILIPLNITKKISIIEKSNKFDNKIIKKAYKINNIRNDLLHFKKTEPKYNGKNIENNPEIIKSIFDDFVEVNNHMVSVCQNL